MTDLLKFLQDNWQWLAAILISFLSFLVHLIQKRPLANSLNHWLDFIVAEFLPIWIREAEKTGYVGSAKKKYVLDKAFSYLHRVMKLDEQSIVVADNHFQNAIENILATPRKKGS